MSALGNDTVEILDINNNKDSGKISGLKEPQGIAFDKTTNQLFVAEGEGGRLSAYNAASLKTNFAVPGLPDADNVRLDAEHKSVLVAYGDGAIISLDAQTGRKLGQIQVGAHPESFQLDGASDRIYANVPDAHKIAIVNRTTMKVQSELHPPAGANFPMALDSESGRLLIACRRPSRLVIYDAHSEKLLQNMPLSGDCDDLFCDNAAHKLYASCGEGFVDVFRLQKAQDVSLLTRVKTSPGARTSLFVPELNRLYVAAPRHGSSAAEVLIFDTEQSR